MRKSSFFTNYGAHYQCKRVHKTWIPTEKSKLLQVMKFQKAANAPKEEKNGLNIWVYHQNKVLTGSNSPFQFSVFHSFFWIQGYFIVCTRSGVLITNWWLLSFLMSRGIADNCKSNFNSSSESIFLKVLCQLCVNCGFFVIESHTLIHTQRIYK